MKRLIPVFLALTLAARAEPTNAPFLYQTFLKDISVYVDTNDLETMRGVFTNVVSGRKPTPQFIETMGAVFKKYRLDEQAIATMRYLTPLCTGGARACAQREEARALFRNGAINEAVDLIVSISNLTGTASNEDRQESGSMKGLGKLLDNVTIQDAFGLRDSLDACLRNAAKGPAAAVKLLKAQGDEVVILNDGRGVDTVDFIWRQLAEYPKEFQDAFRQALEEEAAKARLTLSEADARRHAAFWRTYRGTQSATQEAEQFAWRLLNAGRPELASLWFTALRQVSRSATFEAHDAYARSLTDPLHCSIAGFADAPGQPSDVRSPEGLKLAAGWMAPLFPAEGLTVNSSSSTLNRDRLRPVIVQPSLADKDVILNTGLSMRRYAADTGSNVWTTLYQPRFVDDRTERDAFVDLTKPPVPVFGVLVQGDVVIGRSAGRINPTRQLIAADLTAVDARTGAIRWRTSDIAELAALYVVSEPCAVRGVVCFLAQDYGSGEPICRAVAIEARTGTVLWNRALLIGGDSYGEYWTTGVAYSRELPRPLPTAGGICVATQKGRVFLLDPLTGSVVWMRPYVRMPFDGVRPRGLVNPILSAAGAIILAPVDSAKIIALDAVTGRTLWEKQTALDPFLAGVWRDRIVAFGRGIRLLNAASGATVATASMDWTPSMPFGTVTGNRLWITDEAQTRLFDLPSLQQVDAIARNGRLIPLASMAFTTAPNVVSAVRPVRATATPAPSAGRTVRLRNAPVGKPVESREPAGEVSACLLWETAYPGYFSLPEQDRGLALLYGLQNAKLINANSFGEPYWECQTTSMIRRVFWTDETLALQTDSELLGTDIATGIERWRVPIPGDKVSILYSKGDLFINGLSNNTEVLRINPRDGAVRWRCPTPSNQLAYAIRELGPQVYVELRPIANINAAWYVRELSDDGKFGRELCGNPNLWNDKTWFWDLWPDRVFTVKDGPFYNCWDLALKQSLWHNPFTFKNPNSWATDKQTIPITRAGRPWWFVTSYHGQNAVVDPMSGESLYTGTGRPWNSDFLEVGWEGGIHNLTLWKLQPGKAAEKLWKASFGEWLRSVQWPDTGSALWMISMTRSDAETPTWFLQLDPETGKTLRKTQLLPHRLLPATAYGERVTCKYNNRLIFISTQQKLYCVTVLPAAGVPAWQAERRQAALKIVNPAERARALQFVNVSEQLSRQSVTEWVASRGPLTLDQPWQWMPAAGNPVPPVKDWAGPADVSAVVAGELTPASSLKLIVDVRDDNWVPLDGERGDAVRIGDKIILGLDTRYQTVVNTQAMGNVKLPSRPTVAHTGRDQLRYTIELPAEWRNAYASNPSNTVFNLNLAIRDDDGQGVKGALEWARVMGSSIIRFQR